MEVVCAAVSFALHRIKDVVGTRLRLFARDLEKKLPLLCRDWGLYYFNFFSLEDTSQRDIIPPMFEKCVSIIC